jgi:molecular chaperone DnaK
MARAIGIDLGTTNSCAAVLMGDELRVIPWPNGARTIPSVFAIDKSGKRLIGDEAKDQASLNPENTVTASKRLIGRSFDSDAVARMSQVFTYELVEGQDSEVLVKVAGNLLTLEQVAAAILTRIKDNAQSQLGEPVDAAVITVPAYFNDRQRQSVRTAGRLAGINVLRVLNEPTAAALAYGLGHQYDHRVAIYDLGGGTFDISVIDIRGKEKVFEVIATDGNTFLGGVDFDERVMQQVLKSFYLDHDIDLSFDRSAVTRIHDACERAKIRLSEVMATDIVIPNITKGDDGVDIDLRFHLSRADLEQLTQDLVDRSLETCSRMLREKGLSPKSIDELLLVGGQTRMPLVRHKVETFFGRPGSDKVQPDEAVALGAAIMANALSARPGTAEAAGSDVTLEDVLPMPIGIGRPDGSMYVLFKKNEKLPLRRKRELTTSQDNQKSLVLRVYQGEGTRIQENELLGGFVFHGLRQGPKGTVRLEVTFHIDSEGMLKLEGRDKDTGEAVQVQIRLDHRDEETGSRRRDSAVRGPEALETPNRPSFLDELPEVDAESIDPAPTPQGGRTNGRSEAAPDNGPVQSVRGSLTGSPTGSTGAVAAPRGGGGGTDGAAPRGGAADAAAPRGGAADGAAPRGGAADAAAPRGGATEGAAPRGGAADGAAPRGGGSQTARPGTTPQPHAAVSSVEAPEPEPAPVGINNLRAAARRAEPVIEDAPRPSGLLGWFKKLIGRG